MELQVSVNILFWRQHVNVIYNAQFLESSKNGETDRVHEFIIHKSVNLSCSDRVSYLRQSWSLHLKSMLLKVLFHCCTTKA